jgi:hypothetical protein
MDEKSVLKVLLLIQNIIDERIREQTIPALNSIRMDEGDNKNQLDAGIADLQDHVDVLTGVIGDFMDENLFHVRFPEKCGGQPDDSKTE